MDALVGLLFLVGALVQAVVRTWGGWRWQHWLGFAFALVWGYATSASVFDAPEAQLVFGAGMGLVVLGFVFTKKLLLRLGEPTVLCLLLALVGIAVVLDPRLGLGAAVLVAVPVAGIVRQAVTGRPVPEDWRGGAYVGFLVLSLLVGAAEVWLIHDLILLAPPTRTIGLAALAAGAAFSTVALNASHLGPLLPQGKQKFQGPDEHGQRQDEIERHLDALQKSFLSTPLTVWQVAAIGGSFAVALVLEVLLPAPDLIVLLAWAALAPPLFEALAKENRSLVVTIEGQGARKKASAKRARPAKDAADPKAKGRRKPKSG